MPVIIRNRIRRIRIREKNLKRIAQQILAAAGAPDSELSLELIGDVRMRRLNRRYRKRDAPTDVLSFPMREANGPRTGLLGDVVISLDAADRQARAGGWSMEEELLRLLTHGILHLLGYDHERGPAEARRMRRKEQAIIRSLGQAPWLIIKER
jgi:probable rRNA maturation factor